ncbi:MAG: hypothetical protein SGJ11_01280 [Phycisphaerae bacterium]|nr:hypothetical protein [Phycisphaerae bacterium]
MNDDRASTALIRLRAALGRARPFGAVLGLLLLIAAVVVVLRSGPALDAAWSALRDAPIMSVLALLGSVFAGVFLTGCVFWILTRRFGQVSFGDMQALMAATTLANYLPLRPGLLARVAYHHAHHSIRARDSLRTIVEAMLLSVIALATLVPSLMLAHWLALPLTAALVAPAALGAAALPFRRVRMLALAWELRYLETLLTALRYHIAFALIGAPVPFATSCAIACVSMIATLVPFVSNGIGLREWSIGLLAPVLAGYELEQGLAAELLHRAAEIAVIVPTGLLGFAWLWRRSITAQPAPSGDQAHS